MYNLKQETVIQQHQKSKLGGYYEPVADVIAIQENGLDRLICAAQKLDNALYNLIKIVKAKFSKPDYEAISIFKAILYWYAPIYEIDEHGNKRYKQKFAGELLHKSYAQLSREINLSVPTIKRAVKRLVEAGWIFVSHLTVETQQGDKFSNQTHFKINVDKLKDLFNNKKEVNQIKPIENKQLESVTDEEYELVEDGMEVDQLAIPGLEVEKKDKEVIKSKPNRSGRINWGLTEKQRKEVLYWYNHILFCDEELWAKEGMGMGQPFNKEIKNKWIKHEKFYLDWDKAIIKIMKSRYNDDFYDFLKDFKRSLVMIPNNYFWSNPTRSTKFSLISLFNSQNNNDSITIMARKYAELRVHWDATELKRIAKQAQDERLERTLKEQEQEQKNQNSKSESNQEHQEITDEEYIEILRSVGIELEE
jgi:DNA-binding Lrp family transcriptional regulator